MNKAQPELILPAGSLDKLQVACAYGADAVYAGMPQFSLRARTNSFSEAQLAEGLEYAHARGVKVFLTLNIFARNARLEASLKALRALAPRHPDAVIVSDPGLVMLVRREFPDLELHLSTQANTMNWAAVEFWRTQGVKRVILPRELSIDEIREIHARVPEVDLEVFVHGAMCVSYSGRCLLSSYLTHRDANVGVCTNACRWQYKLRTTAAEYALEEQSRPGEWFPVEEDEHGTYLLNSRDLCAVEYLAELRQAGVKGFKVEGRTKSVYYLALIGRAYRRALDAALTDQPLPAQVFDDIHATANRGLMPGFLIHLPEEQRQNYEQGSSTYSQAQFGGVVRQYDPQTQRVEVAIKNRLEVGQTIEFVSPTHVVAQTLERMWNAQQQPVIVAHGGTLAHVWIDVAEAVAPLTILRIPL